MKYVVRTVQFKDLHLTSTVMHQLFFSLNAKYWKSHIKYTVQEAQLKNLVQKFVMWQECRCKRKRYAVYVVGKEYFSKNKIQLKYQMKNILRVI